MFRRVARKSLLPISFSSAAQQCTGWTAEKISTAVIKNEVLITIKGTYQEAHGQYKLRFQSDGGLEIDYDFISSEKENPRQTGIVFNLAKNLTTLSWKRNGQWSVYPDNHIGRPEGQAKVFKTDQPQTLNFREQPEHCWAADENEMGSNDFRATRRNILWTVLQSDLGDGIRVESDGSQHTRTWYQAEQMHLLVAGFNTGGGDMFLNSHYNSQRQPLKQGDILKDHVYLKFKKQEQP